MRKHFGCSVDGCGRVHEAHGLCRLHYRQLPEVKEKELAQARLKYATDPEYREAYGKRKSALNAKSRQDPTKNEPHKAKKRDKYQADRDDLVDRQKTKDSGMSGETA